MNLRAMFQKDKDKIGPIKNISQPYNFQHVQHVKADPHTSTGFTVTLYPYLS
jgi:hypothetical protein